ncbi:MAG: MBL fold metallo-hydrolase [Proteobacteria bacterium]|nr:MBL fold metallo-hydrolase [Pseudomonadota bacterium]MBU0966225.1 MBL fold metallo-hydrolase [Pseudomonadota bacterium]
MIAPKPTITIVVDNQAGDGLLADNAGKLKIGLEQTDILVLSHGHHDHTGRIPLVLKAARKAKVYCHPGVVQPRYSTRNGTAKAIHMPRESMAAIDKLPTEKLNWMPRARLVARGIGLTGPIPRETDYEDTGGPFFLDHQGKRADPIDDDLVLWIRTEQGLVVCVGCCHAGIVNTIKHVFRLSGMRTLRALIGGFHLLNADDKRLAQTIAALRSFAPELIVPCHCTGAKAMQMLTSSFGERVEPGRAGARYSF